MAHPLGDGEQLVQKANWLGRYLDVERKFDEKLKSVLSDAVIGIDKAFGDLTGDNISSKVRRVQISQSHKAIRSVIKSIFGDTTDLITDHRQDAAVAAVDATLFDQRGILARLFSDPQERKDYAESLRLGARRNIEAVIVRAIESEKPLSARVYKTEALANGQVTQAINRALANGDSAEKLARDVRALIDPNTPGGVSYAAKRLGRTEINNAFHAQSIHDAKELPWVKSMTWHLSKVHVSDPGDECEEYSKHGSFPIDKVPDKPHPNCRCYVTPDQQDYDEFEDELLSGEYDEYLDDFLGVSPPPEEIPAPPTTFKEPTQVQAQIKSLPPPKPLPPKPVEWDGPEIVEPDQDPKIDRGILESWAYGEDFDEAKSSMRRGARYAQENGYFGVSREVRKKAVEHVNMGVQGLHPTGNLETYGKEIVSRAIHSPPSEKPFFRGMQLLPEDIEGYQQGKVVSMGLSSFTEDTGIARDFAYGRGGFVSRSVPETGAKPLIFQLEKGAKIAEIDGIESVAFGRFEILEVLPEREVPIPTFRLGRLPAGSTETMPKTVVLRQVSLLEKEKPKPVAWDGPAIAPQNKNGKLVRAWYDSWTSASTFDEHKAMMRAGAQRAQMVSYEGMPVEHQTLAIRMGSQAGTENPEVLRGFGAEVVAQAVEAPPTTDKYFRGIRITPAEAEELIDGSEISMPLSSFTPDPHLAEQFAKSTGWSSRDIPKEATETIAFQLEPGAKIADIDNYEAIGFGRFEVVGVEPGSKIPSPWGGADTGEFSKVVRIRQVSMLEHDPTLRSARSVSKPGGYNLMQLKGLTDEELLAIPDELIAKEDFVPALKLRMAARKRLTSTGLTSERIAAMSNEEIIALSKQEVREFASMDAKVQFTVRKAALDVEAKKNSTVVKPVVVEDKWAETWKRIENRERGLWATKDMPADMQARIKALNKELARELMEQEEAILAPKVGAKIKDATVPESIGTAANPKQVQNWLEANYDGLKVVGFDTEDVDLQAVKEIAEAFVERQEAFPVTHLRQLRITDHLPEDAVAEARLIRKGKNDLEITFNRRWVNDYKGFKTKAKVDTVPYHRFKTGFKNKGSANLESPWHTTFEHEFGHILDFSSSPGKPGSDLQFHLDPAILPDKKASGRGVGLALWDDFQKMRNPDFAIGIDHVIETPELYAEYEKWVLDGLPSGYSFTDDEKRTRVNAVEAIAESYVNTLRDPNASLVTRAIAAKLLAAYQDSVKKGIVKQLVRKVTK